MKARTAPAPPAFNLIFLPAPHNLTTRQPHARERGIFLALRSAGARRERWSQQPARQA